MIYDPEWRIQEQALNLLRNLACGRDEAAFERVFQGMDKELTRILQSKLNSPVDEVLIQTLYVIVNIAASGQRYKSEIMANEPILRGIYFNLVRQNPILGLFCSD